MTDCCQRTYLEYLDAEGNFSQEAWNWYRQEILDGKPKKKHKSAMAKWKWAMKLFPEKPPEMLCMCKCHRLGSTIVH